MNRRKVLGAGALLAMTAVAGPALAASAERFSVKVRGKGPDVILIPGLSSSPEIWESTAQALEGRYRVHLVHVAGFAGAPTAGNAEGKVAAGVAEGLAGYIQAQGLKSPAVMGHSMGGTIGMMLAARSPSLVGKLMVVDMFPNLAVAYFGPGQSPESIAQRAAGFRAQIADSPADAFKAMQEQVIGGMIRTESARAAIVKHSLDSDRQVSGRAMEELLTTDLTRELEKITAPSTVVWAWNSNVPVPAATFGGWYQAAYGPLKGVKVVRIDDSAHFIMIDQPAKFMAEVESFLAG